LAEVITISLRHYVQLRILTELPTADSDWGCFRGCAISSSLGAPF